MNHAIPTSAYLFVVVCLIFCCGGREASGQGSFSSCDKSEIEKLVLDFGINAEKKSHFGYKADVKCEVNSFTDPKESGTTYWDVLAFEDRLSDSKRYDVLKIFANSNVTPYWGSIMIIKGKREIYVGDQISFREKAPIQARLPIAEDPWMSPISEPQLVDMGRAGRQGYWAELLDMDKLLWCESDGRLVRGEWKFGEGKNISYVQVYFDTAKDGMPVLARFVIPVDLEKRFAKFGRRYSGEIKTQWLKDGEVYLPGKVVTMIENYSSKGVFRSTYEYTTEYVWKSKLVTEKGVSPEVFESRKMLSENLVDAFRPEK